MGLKNFFKSVFGVTFTQQKTTAVHTQQQISDDLLAQLSSILVIGDKNAIRKVLLNPTEYYERFRMAKRKSGFRTISAPQKPLIDIQRRIYQKLLFNIKIHPAAKGFIQNLSVVDNARPHLGCKNLLKVDISSFFGSIEIKDIISVFKALGYNNEISSALASLCCLNGRLPQGAPTSPALSNIVVYKMDECLSNLAEKYNLVYSRYADDLNFSGEFNKNDILPLIKGILSESGFYLNTKKTQYLQAKQRKIITGVSISSGKLTIPKARKRELRKNIHYILTRGINEHKKHIKSNDNLYVERIIGHLNFWLSIEPENPYVKKSIKALKNLV